MKYINRLCKFLFFILLVRPLVLIYIGLNIRNRERLPREGPALLIANHNSHLDTMVLMCMFPITMLTSLRPVAAADYFLKNGFISWFSREIIGIIPLSRKRREPGEPKEDKLVPISAALAAGKVVIFFPEGTRGEAERMSEFKRGIGLLSERHPNVPISPVYLYGLGKSLPKGETLLVPFFCDVFVGEQLYGRDHTGETFVDLVETRVRAMANDLKTQQGIEDGDLYY